MNTHRSFAGFVLAAAIAASAHGQCNPTCADPCECDPNPPSGGCYVRSAQQLQQALAGTSQCEGCTGGVPEHIIIPQGTVICTSSTINLDPPAHNNLHLTVDGTLVWTGDGLCTSALISISGSGITIDGSGLLTSIYVPCGGASSGCHDQNCDTMNAPPGGWPSNARPYIAWAIQLSGASNLTVSGASPAAPLRFSNLSSMVQAGLGGGQDITLRHLEGTELCRYGVFGEGSNWTLEDCHIYGGASGATSYNEHGYRFYASNLTIRDCSAHGVRSGKTGLWIVTGNYASGGGQTLVDGFVSTQHCWLGPNHAADWVCNPPNVSEPALVNATVRNVRIMEDGYGENPKQLALHMGSRQINVINLRTPGETSMVIGRGEHRYPQLGSGLYDAAGRAMLRLGPVRTSTAAWLSPETGATAPGTRPFDSIHWARISGSVLVEQGHANLSADESLYCAGDIGGGPNGNSIWPWGDPDGVVDFDDLLAVILAWGPCPGGSEPRYFCRADINGDDQVNFDDILVIIHKWGVCGQTPTELPYSIQDCDDQCAARFERGSDAWHNCYQKCIQAGCAAGTIPDCQ